MSKRAGATRWAIESTASDVWFRHSKRSLGFGSCRIFRTKRRMERFMDAVGGDFEVYHIRSATRRRRAGWYGYGTYHSGYPVNYAHPCIEPSMIQKEEHA